MPRDDEPKAAKQGEFDADDNNNDDDVFYDVAQISYEDRNCRRASCVVRRASSTMSVSSRKSAEAAAPPATSHSRAIRK